MLADVTRLGVDAAGGTADLPNLSSAILRLLRVVMPRKYRTFNNVRLDQQMRIATKDWRNWIWFSIACTRK